MDGNFTKHEEHMPQRIRSESASGDFESSRSSNVYTEQTQNQTDDRGRSNQRKYTHHGTILIELQRSYIQLCVIKDTSLLLLSCRVEKLSDEIGAVEEQRRVER